MLKYLNVENNPAWRELINIKTIRLKQVWKKILIRKKKKIRLKTWIYIKSNKYILHTIIGVFICVKVVFSTLTESSVPCIYLCIITWLIFRFKHTLAFRISSVWEWPFVAVWSGWMHATRPCKVIVDASLCTAQALKYIYRHLLLSCLFYIIIK